MRLQVFKCLIFIWCFSGAVCCAQNINSRASESEIDITHIKLNIHQFDWQKKQVNGTATIHFVVLKPTDSIKLDAGFLTINSISTGNSKQLKFFYDGKDKPKGLLVKLDKVYLKNSRLSLTINYHTNYTNESDPNNLGGSYGKGIRYFLPSKSNPVKRKQLWSNGEPEGNKYWYPCLESLNDLRTTELIATVDADLTVISNGKLIEVTQAGNDTKTFHYVSAAPYPNYLTNIIVGQYVSIPQFYNRTPLNTFCYPDEKEAAAASANRLTDMADFFSNYTGTAYPYSAYSQVMVQDYPFPSLSGQNGVSTISDNFVDDYRTHKDFLYLWDGVEAEALATQWFGNLVAAKNWNHIWLTKALAHFLEGKFAAEKNGFEEYQLWYQQFDMNATLGDWNAGIHHPLVVKNINDLTTFLTGDNYLRSRGTLILRLLEKEIGEGKFRNAIQYFVKRNAFKTVTSKDFQYAVEYISKRKMDWFFDQWIYKMGQAHFEVSQSYDAGSELLKLKFVQTQKPDSSTDYPQANYFQGHMQIEIDGNLHEVNLLPIKENVIQISLPKAPQFVNVNYERRWIAEIVFQQNLQEYLYQFENSKDVLARLDALNALAGIYKDSATSAGDKSSIYNSLLKAAGSTAYWRFRMNVLSVLNTILTKPFDKDMRAILLNIIQHENGLLKANAIAVLGNENDPVNADLFISQLTDSSDRVIFNAAVALGKTKEPKAFGALVSLSNKPSWKGQSKMAALTGLRLLGDERAVSLALEILKDNHSPRWFLGASGWDYPVYAATLLASFNKGSLGYDIILERFNQALEENDINDVFSNVLLISILADPRGNEVFEKLKMKYKEDANTMAAISSYEEQFNNAIKK